LTPVATEGAPSFAASMAHGATETKSLVNKLSALDHDEAVTVMTSVLQARPELAHAVVNFAVPDLTYPPSKALIERRSVGVIKSFNQERGFGFIQCPELFSTFGNDVFLHRSQLGPHGVGTNVSFAVMLNKDSKPQGYDLMAVSAKSGRSGCSRGACSVDAGGSSDKSGCSTDCWGGLAPFMGRDLEGDMKGPLGEADGELCGGGGALSPGYKTMDKCCMGKGGNAGDANSKQRVGTRQDCGEETPLGYHFGSIRSFNEKTGYGFIACAELKQQYGNDVFLHCSDFEGFQVGEQVKFIAHLTWNSKLRAKDLQNVGDGMRPKYSSIELARDAAVAAAAAPESAGTSARDVSTSSTASSTADGGTVASGTTSTDSVGTERLLGLLRALRVLHSLKHLVSTRSNGCEHELHDTSQTKSALTTPLSGSQD